MASEAPPSPQPDPDVEATAREFIDYTEYLPSDVHRYLQRMRALETSHLQSYNQLDAKLQEFAQLDLRGRPNATASGAGPSSVVDSVSGKEMELRFQISKFLNSAVQARKEGGEEAGRFEQHIARHNSRIMAILSKLNEVVIPSRDPTPEPVRRPEPRNPEQRARIHLNLGALHAAAAASGSRNRNRHGKARPRAHAPQTPRAPVDGDSDDGWEDLQDTPMVRKKKSSGGSAVRPRAPRPPPQDPVLAGGCEARNPDGTLIPNHLLPWNQLTNEELAKLRKRMKKNAGWTPSITMIVRELELLGRGPNHMDDFREQWEGKEWVHVPPEEGGLGDPTQLIPEHAGGRENKGMRLNQAKKRKREEERAERAREAILNGLDPDEEERRAKNEEAERQRQQQQLKRKKKREEEEAAKAAEEAAKREALERAEREKEDLAAQVRLANEARMKAEAEAAELRRKFEEQQREIELKEKKKAEAELAEREKAEKDKFVAGTTPGSALPKKTRSARNTTPRVNTAKMDDEDDNSELSDVPDHVPDLLADFAHIRNGTRKSNSRNGAAPPQTPARAKRGTTTAQPRATDSPPPQPQTGRKRSVSVADPSSKSSSAKPKSSATRRGTAAGPSAKRRGQPGGRKQQGAEAANADADASNPEEEEDLNKYCLCNEVSRGTMVACENDDCPKVWFHIGCVGLTKEQAEDPGLKWWCPICEGDGSRRSGKRRRKG